jgi:hypothetical protein
MTAADCDVMNANTAFICQEMVDGIGQIIRMKVARLSERLFERGDYLSDRARGE